MAAHGHFQSCTAPEHCACEEKRYWIVLCISAVICVLETAGGILSGSLALLSDAVHVLTDAGSYMISIAVARQIHNGAQHRVRTIGGYVSVLLLALLVVWLLVEAWHRLREPHHVEGFTMIVIASIGALGNFIQHMVLEAGHASHITHKSMVVHVRGDLVQNLGVVGGGIIIALTDFDFIDVIVSLFVTTWIAKWTIDLFQDLLTGTHDGDGEHNHHHHH